jgi:hypothetical protein
METLKPEVEFVDLRPTVPENLENGEHQLFAADDGLSIVALVEGDNVALRVSDADGNPQEPVVRSLANECIVCTRRGPGPRGPRSICTQWALVPYACGLFADSDSRA